MDVKSITPSELCKRISAIDTSTDQRTIKKIYEDIRLFLIENLYVYSPIRQAYFLRLEQFDEYTLYHNKDEQSIIKGRWIEIVNEVAKIPKKGDDSRNGLYTELRYWTKIGYLFKRNTFFCSAVAVLAILIILPLFPKVNLKDVNYTDYMSMIATFITLLIAISLYDRFDLKKNVFNRNYESIQSLIASILQFDFYACIMSETRNYDPTDKNYNRRIDTVSLTSKVNFRVKSETFANKGSYIDKLNLNTWNNESFLYLSPKTFEFLFSLAEHANNPWLPTNVRKKVEKISMSRQGYRHPIDSKADFRSYVYLYPKDENFQRGNEYGEFLFEPNCAPIVVDDFEVTTINDFFNLFEDIFVQISAWQKEKGIEEIHF